jgi:hypothetical protein
MRPTSSISPYEKYFVNAMVGWRGHTDFAYHRVNKFDTVIIGGVVACCDHDADRSIALLGTETSNHADGEHDVTKAVGTVA